MTDEDAPLAPAPVGQVERPVGRPVPQRADCMHPNKVERHFTYGYRWHCPDCKERGESWWD